MSLRSREGWFCRFRAYEYVSLTNSSTEEHKKGVGGYILAFKDSQHMPGLSSDTGKTRRGPRNKDHSWPQDENSRSTDVPRKNITPCPVVGRFYTLLLTPARSRSRTPPPHTRCKQRSTKAALGTVSDLKSHYRRSFFGFSKLSCKPKKRRREKKRKHFLKNQKMEQRDNTPERLRC